MRRALLIVAAALLVAPAVPAQTTTAAAGKATHRSATKHGRVDVNSATDKELETLPGVTPAIAKKIVEGRPYASIEDLSHAGLSPGQIDKLRKRVLVGSPARPPKPR